MTIEGWYYLHENGALIYKREFGDTVAELRESTFVKGIWPFDHEDRAQAWTILIESLAAGTDIHRIEDLAQKWFCDNEDAKNYADHVNLNIFMDGNSWCATKTDFTNLQESIAGFGDTALESMAELCKNLGYKPSKMWGVSFKDLISK